jgi:heme oxygenase (mycobilin-producing)
MLSERNPPPAQLGARTMSVDVVINFEAAPGRAAELLPLLREGRDISRDADGCESFELFQRQDDEHKFVFLERWDSIESHHTNMADNILASGHLGRILPLLVGPPDNGVISRVD